MPNRIIEKSAVLESQDLDVEEKLLYAAYGREPQNISMAVLTSVFGGAFILQFFSSVELSFWIAAVLISACLGYLQCRAFRRAAPTARLIMKWRRIYFLQASTHGLAWSLGPTLMMPNSTGVMAAFLIGTVLSVSAVSLNTIAKQFNAMQGFIVAALLPPAISMWLFGAPSEIVLILVLLGSIAAFMVVGHYSNQTARALYETQIQLQGILNSSQDAIISIDAKGLVTDWNLRAETLFGWTRQEAMGLVLNDTITTIKNRAYFQEGMVRFLAIGEGLILNKRIETSALHKNGTEFPIELTFTHHRFGKAFFFTAFITDTTERKAAEERLMVFRRMFDASTQCVVITDASGRAIYQNSAHAKELGYPDQELIGETFADALPKETRHIIAHDIRQSMIQTGGWAGHLSFLRKDGSEFVSVSNIGSIKDDQGNIQYIFNIFTDFSEEIARRNELALAKKAAEQANQAKSDFLSSMSHELRTPMNAILGFAQMLEYDDALNLDQHDNVQEILKGGRHLLDLINEVLDLAKIEAGHVNLSLEPVNVSSVIEDCFDLIQPLVAARKIALHSDVPRHLSVRADRVRLKQSLLNLLSNAVKYNREAGDIYIDVKTVKGEFLRINVRDTGKGIAPERLTELFNAFSRLDAEHSEVQGTGIGLTITRRLVELMGGEVGVRSQIDIGTTFWIDLPCDVMVNADMALQLEKVVVASPKATPLPLTGLQHRVLYIDDNPVNLKLVTHILSRRDDIQLNTAHSPQLGIELALARRPALILLDINMPDMDGYQVLEVFKAHPLLKSIPVVAVTANAMPREIERGRVAGFTGYLTKPLDIIEFFKTIDLCLVDSEGSAV